MMAVGLGVLAWPPAAFWAATVNEYNAAVHGLAMKNGAAASGSESMSRDRFEELMEAYPDG